MKVKKSDVCLFLLPGIILYTMFTIIPGAILLGLAVTKWNYMSFSNIRFVGLANLARAVQDNLVWLSLKHNFTFCVVGVPSQFFLGLLTAILIDKKLRGHSFYRVIFFSPYVLSMVMVGGLWTLLYDPYSGINVILRLMGLESLARNWLGSAHAVYAIILVGIWKSFGFSMVLLLAGLQNIDPKVVESAKLDGATEFQCYTRVIIPLLKPVIVVVILLGIISSFRVFDLVYAMLRGTGSDNSCIVMVLYSYVLAFALFQAGYASAVVLILVFIMTIASYLMLRIARHV